MMMDTTSLFFEIDTALADSDDAAVRAWLVRRADALKAMIEDSARLEFLFNAELEQGVDFTLPTAVQKQAAERMVTDFRQMIDMATEFLATYPNYREQGAD